MGTTTFHLIGYGIVAVMWAVALFGLFEIARNLRPYLAPHASAIFNAIREDWVDHRAKKQAPQPARPVARQPVSHQNIRRGHVVRRSPPALRPVWGQLRTA